MARGKNKFKPGAGAFCAIRGPGSEILINPGPFLEEPHYPNYTVLKGVEGENCNRTACQEPKSAFYFNTATKAWYCQDCAEKINRCAKVDGYNLFPDHLP